MLRLLLVRINGSRVKWKNFPSTPTTTELKTQKKFVPSEEGCPYRQAQKRRRVLKITNSTSRIRIAIPIINCGKLVVFGEIFQGLVACRLPRSSRSPLTTGATKLGIPFIDCWPRMLVLFGKPTGHSSVPCQGSNAGRCAFRIESGDAGSHCRGGHCKPCQEAQTLIGHQDFSSDHPRGEFFCPSPIQKHRADLRRIPSTPNPVQRKKPTGRTPPAPDSALPPTIKKGMSENEILKKMQIDAKVIKQVGIKVRRARRTVQEVIEKLENLEKLEKEAAAKNPNAPGPSSAP